MFFITWFGLVWHDLVWFACVLEIDKYGHKEVGMPRECSKRQENEFLTTVARHGTLACYPYELVSFLFFWVSFVWYDMDWFGLIWFCLVYVGYSTV